MPKYNLRDIICLKTKKVNENEFIDKIVDGIKEYNFKYHNKIDKSLEMHVYSKKKYIYEDI